MSRPLASVSPADRPPEAPGSGDLFAERMIAVDRTLAPAVRRVLRFIDRNRALALASSAMEIAARSGTSDATVVRAAQAIGFVGLGDLKHALAAALDRPSTPADDLRRTLADTGPDAARAMDLVLEAHEDALKVLRSPSARDSIAAAVSTLSPSERIVLFGIGPSAALAHYLTVLLGRAGRRSLLLDRTGRMLADPLLDLRTGDALLVLSYGRPYREVAAVFSEARRLGLPLVLVTDTTEHRLAGRADVVVAVPRGRAERVALHGATLVALEALILGITIAGNDRAMAALERLDALRDMLDGRRTGGG